MHQLPACVGSCWVISPCPFLHPWAFCCISSPLPAKEGSARGVLGGTWDYPTPWRGYMRKKGKLAPFEAFSEESGAIFNFPSSRYAQKIKLLKLWTHLTFLSLKGKRSLSSMFQKKKKNQITISPDKRHSQPTFNAWECFYGQLINCSKQVLQSNENTARTSAGGTAKGLSTWSLHWAQPKCCTQASSASADGAGLQHSRLGDIKLVTKQRWQTRRQRSPDRTHGCQSTEQREQPAQTPPPNPQEHQQPCKDWKDLSQNANWEFSQTVSARAARAQLSVCSCSSSHTSLSLLRDLSHST